jgi:hypothetical protein
MVSQALACNLRNQPKIKLSRAIFFLQLSRILNECRLNFSRELKCILLVRAGDRAVLFVTNVTS